jgi:hypothetical protein
VTTEFPCANNNIATFRVSGTPYNFPYVPLDDEIHNIIQSGPLNPDLLLRINNGILTILSQDGTNIGYATIGPFTVCFTLPT